MQEKYILFYKNAHRGLNTLSHLLSKAKDFTVENGVSEDELLGASIAPDMFPFKKQVQIFTDGVLGGVYRLAGLEKPSLPDTETSIDELMQRVDTARNFLSQINPQDVTGLEDKKIALPWMGGKHFTAETFINDFLFMNNLFHLTTAYNILRMKGIKLGKQDFLGAIEMKD